MKKLRSGLELKKAIIDLLKKEELSIRKLDTKLNTSSQTIITHCKELEFLGVVKIIRYKRNNKNGRPYSIVSLTDYGKKL